MVFRGIPTIQRAAKFRIVYCYGDGLDLKPMNSFSLQIKSIVAFKNGTWKLAVREKRMSNSPAQKADIPVWKQTVVGKTRWPPWQLLHPVTSSSKPLTARSSLSCRWRR